MNIASDWDGFQAFAGSVREGAERLIGEDDMTMPADTELLALEARWRESEKLLRQRNDAGEEVDGTQEQEASNAIERELIAAQPQGVVGLAVKLRHALGRLNPDPRDEVFSDLDWGPKILVRVYEDAERLAASA